MPDVLLTTALPASVPPAWPVRRFLLAPRARRAHEGAPTRLVTWRAAEEVRAAAWSMPLIALVKANWSLGPFERPPEPPPFVAAPVGPACCSEAGTLPPCGEGETFPASCQSAPRSMAPVARCALPCGEPADTTPLGLPGAAGWALVTRATVGTLDSVEVWGVATGGGVVTAEAAAVGRAAGGVAAGLGAATGGGVVTAEAAAVGTAAG